MGAGIREADALAKKHERENGEKPLSVDDVRHDAAGTYVVDVHCADCDAILNRSKEMTGVELAQDWTLIVASSPLVTFKCRRGCRATASDCNANTKLKIKRIAHPEERQKWEDGGEVRNGVITQTENCVGCEQDFEDVRLVGEPRPTLPVCDKCAATMDPQEGESG